MDKGSDQDEDQTCEFAKILEDESVTEMYYSFTKALTDTNHRDHVSAFPVLGDQTCHGKLAILLLEYLNTCPPFEMGLDYRTSSDKDYRPYHENEEEQYEQHSKRSYHYSQVLATHPLAKCAAENLSVHLDKAAVAGSIEKLLATLDRLFVPGKPSLQNWSIFISRDLFPASDSIFHIAAAVRDAPSLPVFVLEHCAELSPHLLDASDHDGRTPLSYAAEGGQADITRFLLDKGANPNSKGKDGRTPLQTALWHPHVVRILVNAGADPLAKRGPILEACNFNGWLGPEVDNDPWRESVLGVAFSQHSDDDGETALYRAARCWMSEIVELLIDRGADPNKRCSPRWPSHEIMECERGPTPLHGVANLGRMECPATLNPKRVVQALISAGADVNAFAAEYGNAQDMTPLHLVVKGTEPGEMGDDIARAHPVNLSLFDLLDRYGADINTLNANGRTPLMELLSRVSCRDHRVEVLPLQQKHIIQGINKLLELAARPDVIDDSGRTIFHYIFKSLRHLCTSECLPLARKLLQAGMDINQKDTSGQPPILLCKSWQYLAYSPDSKKGRTLYRILELFHSFGMDLNSKDAQGRTVLWNIVENSDISRVFATISKLVRLGANPRERTRSGSTLLHAIGKARCNLPSPSIGLSLGADGAAVDVEGNTPIYALFQGSARRSLRSLQELSQTLVSIGGPRLNKNAKGQTVAHLSRCEDDLKAILTAPCFKGLNLDEQDASGFTPLHYACRSGDLATMLALLRNGADPCIKDDVGLTPLHTLAEGGTRGHTQSFPPPGDHTIDIVGPLLRAGADVAARATSSGGNGDNGAEGVTPLDLAVGRQAWVLARELLARGAKPHESYNLPREFVLATDKNEAAEEARRVHPCWRGRWAADRTVSWEAGTRFVTGGQMILDEIAMSEDGDGEFIGFSLLTAALQDGDYDSVKEYAQLGGSLFLRGTGDLHFVDLLVEWECLELLHFLAPDLMKVQDKAIYDTLLGRACLHQEPSLHIIEVLLEGLGVNINSRYNLPRSKRYEVHWGTALHFLADGKGAWRAEGLRYLLTKGSDGKARDEAGMTSLMVCRGEEAARVLRECADPNVTN
ncbi:ankyrin repeat-containing protein [Fusarium bulbicola]|nr:ankyrin repeat-containing protein [Fusarium bulbicola]